MAVNDGKVIILIRQAISKRSDIKDWNARICQAWRDLKALRDLPNGSLDPDLEAAEHYLFARQAVGSGTVSRNQMTAQARGYEMVKFVVQTIGLEKTMRNNPDNPTAPASYDVGEWGARGAWDGEGDRMLFSSGTKPPFFNVDFTKY